MLVSVLNDVVMPILRFCVNLFFQVVDSLDARGFIFGAFIIITITRFLLLPLIKGKAIDMGSQLGDSYNARKEREYMKKDQERARKEMS